MRAKVAILPFLLALAWTPLVVGEGAPAEQPNAAVSGAMTSEGRRATVEALLAQATKDSESSVVVIVDHEPDPSRIAGAAYFVPEKKLETYEYDDVQRVLQSVPGVYLRVEDGFGLRPNIGLRGASSDRSSKVTLMEDGVLLAPAPYAAPAAYFFPLVTTMRQVEVYKGPAAVRFGPQTVGGAINLLTPRMPLEPMGELDIAGGTFGFLKVHGRAGSGSDRYGVLVEGVHLQSSGFKELDGGGDTGFDKDELRLKFHVGTDPSRRVVQRVGLKLGYAEELSNETYVGLNQSDFDLTPYRRYSATQRDQMQWRRKQVEVRHKVFVGDALQIETVGYRHGFERTWAKLAGFGGGVDLGDLLASEATGQSAVYLAILQGEEDSSNNEEALIIGTNSRAFVSQGVASTLHFRHDGLTFGHALEVGARAHYDHIERDHTSDTFMMTGGELVASGDITNQSTLNRGEARAIAAFATDEVVFRRWIFTPGARTEFIWTRFYDRLDEDGLVVELPEAVERFDPVFLPGMGVLYQAQNNLALLAGVNRGFSAVAPGQSAEVKPEWSLNYEGGFRAGSANRRLEAIGFFNDYSNITAECSYSRGCEEAQLGTQYNGGEVDVFGVETSAALRLDPTAGPLVDLSATYTLTQSRFRSSFESSDPALGDVELNDSLPYVPVHQGSAQVGVEGQRWRADATASAVGAMRNEAGQGDIGPGEGTDSFVVFDLAAYHEIADFGRVYLKVDNLTNNTWVASVRPQGLRPGKPQQLVVGYKHAF